MARDERVRASVRSVLSVLSAALLAACQGDGSDIGPKLAALPSESCKVVVLDDLGRGVVEARATVAGRTALTGRNGRGDLASSPRGRQLVDVDGSHAAAVAGDRLGRVRFAATIVGPDLPAVVFLPDLPDGSSAALALGTQAGATTVTAPSGGRLTVAAGASVGSDDPAATTVTLRTGALQASHVPGDLPAATAGALLTGAVFCIDPPGVTFTPAADLDVADDLGLGAAGTATLFRLDAVTGEWTAVRSGLAAAAGRIQAPNAVAGGGCYVFGVDVPAASLAGRVVLPTGAPVPGTIVTVDGRATTSDAAGRFVVTNVPGARADGSARNAVVELFAGGSWLPARVGSTFAITPGADLDVGDLGLDTTEAGNVRVQQVRRGRAEVLRPTRLGATCEAVAQATLGDAAGQALFEDMPARWFGFQDGRPIDGQNVFYSQGIGFLDPGRRWFDTYQFFDERPWFLGSRRTRALVTDSVGGGPQCDVTLVRGSVAGEGRIGISNESGSFFVDRDFSGRATATLRTERDGQVLVHAFSIERPNGDHLELPIQRVLRRPLAAFDRHGLVAGTLTGADPARQHRLRATRRLDLQEWWDDVVEGIPIASSLPIDVDPATTHAAFQAGVSVAGGHLVATELTSPGGLLTLQKVGLVADLVPTEGATIARDIALDLPATTTFTLTEVLVSPPPIDLSTMTLALAVLQPTGRVIDVVRGLRGNHNGSPLPSFNLTFQLPSLTGGLQDHKWLAVLQGSLATANGTIRTSAMVALPLATSPGFPSPFGFRGVPDVTAPADGGAVPATGFTVDFALPSGALYGTLELRSATAGETLLWQVVVPPDLTQFAFVTLPAEAATPLVAGRSYTLTVSAYFGTSVLATSGDAYRDLSGFVQSIGATELGVTQVTRRSLTLTTN
ncbi:MAG: carboxypeptidase regulatory-like domain-containing protein [Planctomycetes bacterium]|nr:carboxypeptidase regulatory-like domain-containing protein [Planctomycetota bacterium]